MNSPTHWDKIYTEKALECPARIVPAKLSEPGRVEACFGMQRATLIGWSRKSSNSPDYLLSMRLAFNTPLEAAKVTDGQLSCLTRGQPFLILRRDPERQSGVSHGHNTDTFWTRKRTIQYY